MLYKDYFPMLTYYKNFVMPINPRHFKIKSDKMMVCPLHDDINPSMGIIYNGSGDEIFHCFGCNKWGSIVDLHMGVCRRLLRKYLNEEEALKDLCRIFNIPIEKVKLPDNDKKVDESIQQELAIRKAIDRFDISDYRQMIVQGKLGKKPLAYFNTLMVMMINEIK